MRKAIIEKIFRMTQFTLTATITAVAMPTHKAKIFGRGLFQPATGQTIRRKKTPNTQQAFGGNGGDVVN